VTLCFTPNENNQKVIWVPSILTWILVFAAQKTNDKNMRRRKQRAEGFYYSWLQPFCLNTLLFWNLDKRVQAHCISARLEARRIVRVVKYLLLRKAWFSLGFPTPKYMMVVSQHHRVQRLLLLLQPSFGLTYHFMLLSP